MKNILAYLEIEDGSQSILTAEGNIAFALVMNKTGNYMVALEYLEKSYYTFLSALGEFDPKTKEVAEMIKNIEENQRDEG